MLAVLLPQRTQSADFVEFQEAISFLHWFVLEPSFRGYGNMDDIIGEQRKQAIIPISVSLLSLAIGIAVSWNALDGQVSNRSLVINEQENPATVSSIDELLARTGLSGQQKHPNFDPKVERIQLLLNKRGLYNGKIDGVTGPATRSAMAAYRKKNGIIKNDNEEQAILDHIRFTRQISAAAEFKAPEDDGVSKKTVGLIQTGLSELGYDPGPVDGEVGAKTKDAIRDFQRDRSLKPTGLASDGLLIELRKVTGLTSLNKS